MKSLYVLNEKLEPVLVTTEQFFEYVAKNGEPARQVKLDFVDGVKISTTFLGVALVLLASPDNPPLLFETFVFGKKHDGLVRRYRTWEDAVAGHAEVVDLVKNNEPEATD